MVEESDLRAEKAGWVESRSGLPRLEVRPNTFLLKAELVEVSSKNVSLGADKAGWVKAGWVKAFGGVSRLEVRTKTFLLKAEWVEVWSKKVS